MARLQAVERQLEVNLDKYYGEAHRQAFIAIARQGLEGELADQGQRSGTAGPSYRQTVDGTPDAPLEQVKLGGQIRFDFNYLAEIVLFALETLRDFSPVRSGRYRDAHFVTVSGVRVDPAAFPPDATEALLSNDEPYSRKIEVGHMHLSVPHGIHDRARQAVAARYGNIVTADVQFAELAGGYVLKGSARRHKAGEIMSYPSLHIALRI